MASKVAEILAQMAQNAGQTALRRGALLGGTIAQAADVPAQYFADQDRKKLEDLHTAQVQQQMQLEQARGSREAAAAQRQVGLDTRAQTAQNAADLKEQALKGIIGAGFEKDPATFDLPTAVSKAKELGAEDLIPTIMAVHEKMQPKIGEAAPGSAGRYLSGPQAGALVPNSVVPAPVKPPTAEEDKAKYIGLQARGAQNLPVLPAEKAWMDAYEKEKGLNIDKSASAAADRQAAAIAAQTAQQGRAQSFAEAQAGRAQITAAEKEYRTAQNSANTLRDVVAEAKSGNKLAASLQPLEATMSAIRAQGLNRINATEVGATAGAGSIWDRLSGYVGKKLEGQPVPADIQNDMIKFADVLEKSAYAKYIAAHKSATARYALTNEQPLPEPAPFVPAGPPTPLTPGLAGVANRK